MREGGEREGERERKGKIKREGNNKYRLPRYSTIGVINTHLM